MVTKLKSDSLCYKAGSTFNDVDLAEGEWADYDEKIEESTMISEIQSKFIKMK